MDWIKVVELAIPALIAVVGWFIASRIAFNYSRKQELIF